MDKNQIHEHCLTMVGASCTFKEEWGAFLFMVGGKFFAMMGNNKNGDDIISLKSHPERAIELRAAFSECINPGYYLNKTHWNSINIPNDLDDTLMKSLIKDSYTLVFNGLTKKLQKELLQEVGDDKKD